MPILIRPNGLFLPAAKPNSVNRLAKSFFEIAFSTLTEHQPMYASYNLLKGVFAPDTRSHRSSMNSQSRSISERYVANACLIASGCSSPSACQSKHPSIAQRRIPDNSLMATTSRRTCVAIGSYRLPVAESGCVDHTDTAFLAV